MTNKGGYIFLSHTHADKSFVRRLASDLRERGVKVWLDEWELGVGDSLTQRIQASILEAGYLALVLSPRSVTSAWVNRELSAALTEELHRKGVFILPILIEDCDIPLFIQDKMYADFRYQYSDGLDAILRTVLPGEGTPPKLIFDTHENDPTYATWAVHCSDGASKARLWRSERTLGTRVIGACATAQQSVGLNKSIPTLHGRVSFEYRVVSTTEIGDHIYFVMIPIQETGYQRSGVIEVGADRPADPRNPKSPYRIRYTVPRNHQEDTDWHTGTLDFDFREVPTAFYSIFAFRINEGIDQKKEACMELGRVRVYSW
jgi:hypothetical protein